jgi:nitroreductase
MKTALKGLVPAGWLRSARRFQARLTLHREFHRDRKRYATYRAPADNAVSKNVRPRNLEAQLTKDYHRIEKGLALRDPKRPFGSAVAERIDLLLPAAAPLGAGAALVSHTSGARSALEAWNQTGVVSDTVSPTRAPRPVTFSNPTEFLESRHSVRDFDDQPIDDETLERAVALAINSPSVCNRQPWRAYIYRQPEMIQKVLRFQNGNRGFSSVPAVAVITVDTQLFTGIEERNQGWIEGGIFSMSLVWALHGLGIDSCMLNMSVLSSRMDALRRAVGIADNELIIMMIAVGRGRDGHRVARSPHRAVEDVLVLD